MQNISTARTYTVQGLYGNQNVCIKTKDHIILITLDGEFCFWREELYLVNAYIGCTYLGFTEDRKYRELRSYFRRDEIFYIGQ